MVTADRELLSVKFTKDDANAAAEVWGFNCGPSAIAAVAGLTIDEVRPQMGDFELKRYTNPTLMRSVLKRISVRWRLHPRTPVECRGPASAWRECSGKVHGQRLVCPYQCVIGRYIGWGSTNLKALQLR